MHNSKDDKLPTTWVWVFSMVCMAVIIFAICGGIAYSSIQQARLAAAKASIGHIEAVLLLAEKTAEEEGLGTAPATYSSLLKSYGDSFEPDQTAYEKFVVSAMLQSFGPNRGFDFAITRFQDTAGIHTEVYFFPTKGRTNQKTDRYYLAADGVVTENNT